MNADVDTDANTLAVAEVTTLAETLGNVSNDALVDMMLTRSQRLRLILEKHWTGQLGGQDTPQHTD